MEDDWKYIHNIYSRYPSRCTPINIKYVSLELKYKQRTDLTHLWYTLRYTLHCTVFLIYFYTVTFPPTIEGKLLLFQLAAYTMCIRLTEIII